MSKLEEDYEDSGLELIEDKPTIYIPRYLEDLMYTINRQKKVDANCEFSIFCVAKEDEGYDTELTREYFIPKQMVHSTEVEYLQERPAKRFNTVIHRHPDSMPQSFSRGDDEYINRNFDVSILWTNKDSFSYGQYNLYKNRSRLVIPCEIVIVPSYITVKHIENISPYVHKKTGSYVIENDNIVVPTLFLHNQPTYYTGNSEYEEMYNSSVAEEDVPTESVLEQLQFTVELLIGQLDYETGNTYARRIEYYKPNYAVNCPDRYAEFVLLMAIFDACAKYWLWTIDNIKAQVDSLAKAWLDKSYIATEARISRMVDFIEQNIK